MLSNVLAGVRDIRAPLAAGYIWMLTGYLAVACCLPPSTHLSGVAGDVYVLAQALPLSALIASSAFVAYLVGAASQDLSEFLVKRIARLARYVARRMQTGDPPNATVQSAAATAAAAAAAAAEAYDDRATRLRNETSRCLTRWAGSGDAVLSLEGESAVREICEQRVRDIERMLIRDDVTSGQIEDSGGRWPLTKDPAETVAEISEALEARRTEPGGGHRGVEEEVQKEVLDALGMIKLRLLTSDPEVHAAVDRIEAESAVRLAIVPPMVALMLVLVLRQSISFLGALPALALFWHQGMQRRKQRGDNIVHALALRLVDAPYLERLASAATEMISDAKRRRADPPSGDSPAGPV